MVHLPESTIAYKQMMRLWSNSAFNWDKSHFTDVSGVIPELHWCKRGQHLLLGLKLDESFQVSCG